MTLTNLILASVIILLLIYCGRLKLRQQSKTDKMLQWKGPKVQVSNNDVMQYIRDTTDTFRPYLEQRGLDFTVNCSPESMMGWIDTDKIDKILQLFIADMATHATEEGKISIDINTNERYENVIIRIRDNGPRISSTTQFIALNLVNIHQGNLSCKYYEGQGNTIAIDIPITREAYTDALSDTPQQALSFHIPTNIELHVPTIELPTPNAEGESPLEAIFHQQPTADQEYLQRAIRCINEHLSDSDYSRETFAQDMGSSVSTLYNKIRALTGKNITNFVRDIRIKKACQLARENPDLRVSDIAYQVGFRDPKYFATSFKRVMGMQPKEYISLQKSAGH